MKVEKFYARGAFAAVIECDIEKFSDEELCRIMNDAEEAFMACAREHARQCVASVHALSPRERRGHRGDRISLKIRGEGGDVIRIMIIAERNGEIASRELFWSNEKHIFIRPPRKKGEK